MHEGLAGTERRSKLETSCRSREMEAPESSRKQIHSQVKQTEKELYGVCYISEVVEIAGVRERKEKKSTLQRYVRVCV